MTVLPDGSIEITNHTEFADANLVRRCSAEEFKAHLNTVSNGLEDLLQRTLPGVLTGLRLLFISIREEIEKF
jgi:hypothetical protein